MQTRGGAFDEMPSESPDGGGQSEMPASTPIDLQTHTVRQSPAETLAALSGACHRLGIDAFDVYGDFESDAGDSYLRRFEAEVARSFGKEDGVFCLSGGMAQSIALIVHAKNRARADEDEAGGGVERALAFACHPTSHLLLHENDAYSELLGMEAVVIDPDGERKHHVQYDPEILKASGCYGMDPLRLSHVQELFSSIDDAALARYTSTHPNRKPIALADVSTLILELPHREVGGKLTPWEEVEEMARLCEERGVTFHCDGARIFEASAGYGHQSVAQTAQPFESVYVSFYKGLGAVSGAMLLGNADFCSEARVWLRRFGGNLYSVLPYAVSCWDGFRANCLKEDIPTEDGERREGRLVYDNQVFESRRRKLARVLEQLNADARIASVVRFDPVVPETNIVHGYLKMTYDECMAAVNAVERNTGIRVLNRVRRCTSSNGGSCGDQSFGCRFELTMGAPNSLIEDELYVLGWSEFARVASG